VADGSAAGDKAPSESVDVKPSDQPPQSEPTQEEQAKAAEEEKKKKDKKDKKHKKEKEHKKKKDTESFDSSKQPPETDATRLDAFNEDGTPRVPEDENREPSSDTSIYDEELIDPALWKRVTLDDEIYEDYEYLQKQRELEDVPRTRKGAEPLTEKQEFQEWEKKRMATRAPVILTFLTDRSGPLGSTIKLTCSASGQENKIAWYKGEEQLERGTNVQWQSNDGLQTLSLMNVTFKEQGLYTCEFKNRGGLRSTSCHVYVYEDLETKKEIPPTISLIRDYFHHKLNYLIVEVHCEGSHQPTIEWFKDDIRVLGDDRVLIKYDFNQIYQLCIHDPTPEDSGVYKCVAWNLYGRHTMTHTVNFTAKVHPIHFPNMHHAHKKILTDEEKEALALAEVEKIEARKTAVSGGGGAGKKGKGKDEPYVEESFVIRDSKNKLKMTAELTSRTVFKGDKFKLYCSVEGPSPVFKWVKNEKPVEWSERIKNMTSFGIGMVEIDDANKNDAGEYVCNIKNPYGTVTSSCFVKVIEKPPGDTIQPIFTRAIKGKRTLGVV
jgi:Immunoglobulin I-set domain